MSLNKKAALIFVLLFSCFLATKADALAGASFSLSPSSGTCIPGGTFNLNIVLQSDTPASGATAIINYDPSILEARSIINGTIFPIEILNSSVDPVTGEYVDPAGKIRLDAGANYARPNNFTGSGTFGTIKFKVLRVGSASLSFVFTPGSTKGDSTVAHAETFDDILTTVTGGSYTFEEGNTDSSLDPSCVPGGGTTPTPTPTTPPGAPTPTPTTPPGAPTATPTPVPVGGGAPEGGILGPTIFLSLLSFLMIGAGLILR